MSEVSFKNLSREMAGRSSWGNSLIILIVFALLASLSVWSNYAELDSVTRGDSRRFSSADTLPGHGWSTDRCSVAV